MERDIAKAVYENYNTDLHVSALYLLSTLLLTILNKNKTFSGFEIHITYEVLCWTEGTVRVYLYISMKLSGHSLICKVYILHK
jgi:hypothetical protein